MEGQAENRTGHEKGAVWVKVMLSQSEEGVMIRVKLHKWLPRCPKLFPVGCVLLMQRRA